MKKFKFRYANILKLREDRETEVKAKLKKENQRLEQLESHKIHLESDYRDFRLDIQLKMKEGIKGHEAKQINDHQLYFRKKIEKAKIDILRQQNVIENVKAELAEAMKERKIMEKLEEKELAAYHEAMRAQEVKETDEVVNFQNSKRSGD